MKPAVVWVCLCALSIVSVVMIEHGGPTWVPAVLATVIAAIKARLIIKHYMEVTRARPVWRMLYGAWTFAAAAALCIGYLLSLRV
jgi:hypothetical protein